MGAGTILATLASTRCRSSVPFPYGWWWATGIEAVIERIGRLADGWFPQFAPDDVGGPRLSACVATRGLPDVIQPASASKGALA